MAKVYKSICNEMDEIYCTIMHLSEKGINYKLRIEQVMDMGFGDLAKARYIMGSKCVSLLQLPTAESNPIQPISTVCRGEHKNHWVFKIHRRTPCPLSPSDSKTSLTSNVTKTYDVHEMMYNDVETLRKRKDIVLVKDHDYVELKEDMLDEIVTPSQTSSGMSSCIDPIRLFGVLVPQTLRTAQKSFVDVLQLLMKCATIQSEMDSWLVRYYHLKKVKNLIEITTVNKDVDIYDDREYWTPSIVSEVCVPLEYMEKFAPEEEFSLHSFPPLPAGEEPFFYGESQLIYGMLGSDFSHLEFSGESLLYTSSAKTSMTGKVETVEDKEIKVEGEAEEAPKEEAVAVPTEGEPAAAVPPEVEPAAAEPAEGEPAEGEPAAEAADEAGPAEEDAAAT